MNYALRPAVEQDLPFIRVLHEASMRPHVERQFGIWDKDFQRKKFEEAVPKKDHQIIEVDGTAIGLLHVLRDEAEILLDQIWLLPSHQGQGIGSRIISGLAAESQEKRLPVRLQVLVKHPSQRLGHTSYLPVNYLLE